jgi:hypothetical protein
VLHFDSEPRCLDAHRSEHAIVKRDGDSRPRHYRIMMQQPA